MKRILLFIICNFLVSGCSQNNMFLETYGSSPSSDFDKKYMKAVENIEADPGKSYDETLAAYVSQNLKTNLEKCTKSNKEIMAEKFYAVVHIDNTGNVISFEPNRINNLSVCIKEVFESNPLPRPTTNKIFIPFYYNGISEKSQAKKDNNDLTLIRPPAVKSKE